MSNEIKLQILEFNLTEHHKAAKDLMFLPLDNPRRVEVEKSMNKVIEDINKLKRIINEKN